MCWACRRVLQTLPRCSQQFQQLFYALSDTLGATRSLSRAWHPHKPGTPSVAAPGTGRHRAERAMLLALSADPSGLPISA
eukprot:10774965-Alexandrium_andersonii.AAC.1